MRRIVLVVAILLILIGCEAANSNWGMAVSPGTSRIVAGVKVYGNPEFAVFRIVVDGRAYLVNSEGGILEVK